MPNTRRTFMAAAGIGLLAAQTARSAAGDEEKSPQEKANVQLVADFCTSWATRDLTRILPRLSADCIYRMSETTAPVKGHAGVREQLGTWMTSSDLGVEFLVLQTFASGPMVMNRRIDSFRSTTRPLTWEGVGIFFIRDGLITEWSDYTIRVDRSGP